MKPRIASLCSGYGGLDLAVEAVFDAVTVAHCEWEPAPSAVLAHRWPGVPNLHDVKTADWSNVDADILTAGYPCQPFSTAGARKGTDDPRHLWPYVAATIRGVRPRLVVLENVAGHRTLGLDAVLGDLAALGYDATWTSIRAADVGAPHGRERLFIVAADTARDPWGVGDGDDVRARRPSVGREPSAGRGVVAQSEDVGHERRRPARDGRPGPSDSGVAAADAEYGREPDGSWSAGREGGERASVGSLAGRDRGVLWGEYGPAIGRWEHVLGRVAPAPTEPGPRGGQRLSPRFVEWMMGLPTGWVTDVPGISRNAQLKMLGNGVVPQQAAAALRWLLALEAVAA